MYLPYFMRLCLAFKYPFSSQIAAWAGSTKNAYLELVYMFNLFSFPNSKALVRAIHSASCAEVRVVKLGPLLFYVRRQWHIQHSISLLS